MDVLKGKKGVEISNFLLRIFWASIWICISIIYKFFFSLSKLVCIFIFFKFKSYTYCPYWNRTLKSSLFLLYTPEEDNCCWVEEMASWNLYPCVRWKVECEMCKFKNFLNLVRIRFDHEPYFLIHSHDLVYCIGNFNLFTYRNVVFRLLTKFSYLWVILQKC